MEMLRINGLHKRFGDKEVLKGLELAVPEHSVFGFVGKNGAGKTTTMKTVLGLMKQDRGEIFVAGEPVCYGQTKTNRYIGYLPDVPEFYPFMTAPEYLSFCAELSGMDRKTARRRSGELLELVGLAGERHRVRGFSRGMKQRLGLAQALLGEPKLLICDEPTSALDPVGRRELLELLLTVREKTTVVFSTHILSDVERICTDVAFLDGGVVTVQGTLQQVKSAFRTDGHMIEPVGEDGVRTLLALFPRMERKEGMTLVFREGDHPVHEVLKAVSDRRLPLVRLERLEPSLEDLFMEVVDG